MGRYKSSGIGKVGVKPPFYFKKPNSALNSCIALKTSGKTGGGRAGARQRFATAAKECSGRG